MCHCVISSSSNFQTVRGAYFENFEFTEKSKIYDILMKRVEFESKDSCFTILNENLRVSILFTPGVFCFVIFTTMFNIRIPIDFWS